MEFWWYWHAVLSAHQAYCNKSQRISQYMDHTQISAGKSEKYIKPKKEKKEDLIYIIFVLKTKTKNKMIDWLPFFEKEDNKTMLYAF